MRPRVAHVLHAQPNPIAQTISAWPPLALFLTVELVSRVPIYRRSLAAIRLIATTCIATIAAWVSYWHMTGVASRYGETGSSPYLLPISVDGLIVVASISLIELSNRIRDTHPATTRTPTRPASAPGDESRPAPPATAHPPEKTAAESDEDQPAPLRGASDEQPDFEPALEADNQPENDDQPEDDVRLEGDDRLDDEAHGFGHPLDVPAELAPLLPAARAARDALTEAGRSVSRDALAAQMRRDGHAVRNHRASELLNVLKRESVRANGRQPASP